MWMTGFSPFPPIKPLANCNFSSPIQLRKPSLPKMEHIAFYIALLLLLSQYSHRCNRLPAREVGFRVEFKTTLRVGTEGHPWTLRAGPQFRQ
jgi:hypothetical protein